MADVWDGGVVLPEVVGRDSQLLAMRQFLVSDEEPPGLLVLIGDPGIGKTTLWQAGLDIATAAGTTVLRCAPNAAEASLAYAALADLAAQIDPGLLDALPTPQRRAFDQVLLRAREPTQAIDARAVGAALLSLLEELGTTAPVLLAVDDWQWMDLASQDAVGFALRRISTPTSLLVSVRIGHPEVLGLLEHDRITRLEVGPLEPVELHRVLESRFGRTFPRPSLDRLAALSGGNPWFALELARSFDPDDHHHPTRPLPETLGQLVGARLAEVDAPTLGVLRAAAALADARVEHVLLVVDGDDVELQRRLEAAEVAGLIEFRGNRIAFTHPLLAAGVLEEIAAPERRDLHRRLAGVVTGVEERAHHLALAAVRAEPETLAALDQAAAHARVRGAPAAAAAFLEHALRLGAITEERRLALIGDWFDAGDVRRARSLAEKAVSTLPAGLHRASVLRLLATIRLHDDSYQEAAALLEEALHEPGADGRLRGELLVEHIYVLTNLGRILDARARAAEAVAELESLGGPALLARALAASAMTRYLCGEGLDEPARLRSLELEDIEERVPVMLRPRLISALLLAWSGRLDEGRASLRAERQGGLERGAESDVVYAAFHLAIFDCWAGDLASARLVADDSLERARELGSDIARGTARAAQAVVAAYAGEVDEGRAAAREALETFRRGSALSAMVWPTVTLGLVELSIGNHAAAADILSPLVEGARAMGYGEPTAAPYAADAAEAMIGAGRLEKARELVGHLEAEGRRLDRPWALALGARCRALLLAAEGELDSALAAVETALEEHRRLPMPFEQARTHMVLGQVQRRRRQKRASAAAFEQALATFEAMGARLWADRARSELERSTSGRVAGNELSPSEERVAELAATGLTNREMARALGVHPKTVEAHLARVYRKFGIGSRAELGRCMAVSDATSG
ncbi:LuxR family transcriptional regulator [Nocardioides sp.]|uniref:helix-turn-helix transcriptional regulator n=1 Tax=Nocardioides sp. TaxID=35761 RepID=UPI0027341235|nr:LuxR family transcriptional regulator [Nocardioides sp.]MDP3894546.1 AAA family ATPase [Nocardioides sp.]